MKLEINIYDKKLSYYYIYDLLVYNNEDINFVKTYWIDKIRTFKK
jgi:hypothetical protein